MKAINSGKNYYIELEWFIACFCIVLFHADIMPLGWTFVEFFYILTGVFTMQHMQKIRYRNPVEERWYPFSYVWSKIKRLLPYTTLGIMMIWVNTAFAWKLTGTALLKWILYLPANLLLLSGFGVVPFEIELRDGLMTPPYINPQLWYIACMIPALIILVLLLQHMKKSKVFVLTILPLILFGLLIAVDGTVAGWHKGTFGIFGLDMRALGGMLIGVDVWYLKEWLKKKSFSSKIKLLFTIVEVVSFFGVFAYAWFLEQPFDIVSTLLFVLSTTLTLSGQTYTAKLNFRIFGFLGRLSIPIYCLQLGFAEIVGNRFSGIAGTLVKGVGLFVFCVICYLVIEGIRKKIHRKDKAI
ncbi:MAG: hypothetical protein IKE48_00575 [Parasporobacterium sp.]|nr:hypothetical protein [Parasporobacterium sp.]